MVAQLPPEPSCLCGEVPQDPSLSAFLNRRQGVDMAALEASSGRA